MTSAHYMLSVSVKATAFKASLLMSVCIVVNSDFTVP